MKITPLQTPIGEINIFENDSLSIQVEVGVTYENFLIVSIGDTLGMTPIIEQLYKKTNKSITVSTTLPELFLNNPYVGEMTMNNNPQINLSPCLLYECNIIKHYAEQMGMELSKYTKPKIYLSSDEIEYGKTMLKEFEGFRKIAVSIEGSADSKNLRYWFISPLLDRLKKSGYKLIEVGNSKYPKQYEYNKSFLNSTTIREVCAIINCCDMYLGVDSGLFHISAALNIPQVVFFRNAQSCNNSYYDTFYFDSKIKCKDGCLARHLVYCENENARCMDNFDLDEYYDIITKILPI